MPYAELHCHSCYSFHDGASSVEELVLRARELGYAALALMENRKDLMVGVLGITWASAVSNRHTVVLPP